MTFSSEKDQRASASVASASVAASRLFGSETAVNANLVSSMLAQQMALLSMATAFNVAMARQFSNIVLSAWDQSLEVTAKTQPIPNSERRNTFVVEPAAQASKLRVVVDNKPAPAEPKSVPNKVVRPSPKAAAVTKPESVYPSRDDLKQISGIGPKLETILQGKGINRFSDIARLSAARASKLDAELGLGGRISRDQWVQKAKALVKEQA